MKQSYKLLFVAIIACATNFVNAQTNVICPISAGPDQSICVPNCATLTGTFVPTNQTTSYTVGAIPYAPDPYNVGTAVALGDDQWSPVIALPFTFCFYGNAYNSCLIGSNGMVSFNLAGAGGYCQWPIGAAIPSAADPMNTIMGPWQDLYPPAGGTIRYTTYGTAPCRRFVVSWYQVGMYSCTTTLCTQQITLFETTNIIQNHIQTKGTCGWNGGYAIQGLHNATGTAATVNPGRNWPSVWTTVNNAIRYTPSGLPTYTIGWYQGATLIASTATTVVCPTTTTVYTFQQTSTNCNGVPVTVSDPMTVTTSSLILSGTQTNVTSCSVCNGSASVSVVSGTGPFTYSWAPSGGAASIATGLCAGTYTCTVTGAAGCQGTQTFNITAPSTSTSTQSQTNVTCNAGCNGTATITPSPAGVYTYSWLPSGGTSSTATGLCAGTYTATATNTGGCTTTQTIIITQPTAITATQSQGTILCNGGTTTASVVASGGTPGYTYVWTPSGGTGATSTTITAGSYTCTITDANGCIITRTFSITQPPVLAATSSSSSATCGNLNGSASVVVSGGTPGYTYSWAPIGGTLATAPGLGAGTYTCTITDANGCVITRTVTVASTNSLTASVTTSTPVSCFGGNNGTATVTPVGGNPGFIYSWAPLGGTGQTGTGLSSGNYTVTVTDAAGCNATATVNITQPTAVTATTSQTNVTCFGGNNGTATVVPSGGTPGYAYSWSPIGGTGSTGTGLTAGSYTCTITDANGCIITRTFAITQATLITATSTTVTATCGNPNGSATVTPGGGTPGYTFSWAPFGGTGATATGLAAGSYTCTITDAASCVITTTVSITNAGSPTATISGSTNVSCFGGTNGSASVTAAGGTGPYTYTWSPSGGTGATATGLPASTYTVTVNDANNCTAIATVTITQPPVLSATSSQINILCNGGNTGSATVVAAGGTVPYTYAWTPSGGSSATATGLTAGNYTCTITDANGCTTTQTFNITAPSPITATQSQVNVLCNGGTGSATVVASGGVAPYSYAWSPTGGNAATGTPLIAGNYTCVITDANGCTLNQTFTITQPTPLTGTTTTTQSTCGNPNGSATVTPAGGIGPYTYSWAPSGGTAATATGLLSNIYTVTITDGNGCTTTVTANVLNAGSPTATISTSTNISCFGGSNGSATVTAAGGTAPYTYLWTPSGGTGSTASGLTANSYNVTVTDANGCTATASVLLTEPPVLTATVSSMPVLCNGGNTGSATVTASGGVSTYNYAWAPSGGNAATAPNLAAGNYTCTVTDANGCLTTASIIVTQPTALAVVPAQVDASCNGGNTGSASVTVSGGTSAYTYAWTPSGGNVATEPNLAAGNYTCTVTDANGCIITQSFIITEPTLLTVTTTTVSSTCGSPNGSATAIAAGGTPAYTYSWSSGGTTATENNLAAGSYVITVTDSKGCTATATAVITNMGSPTVTITSSTNVSCFGGNNGSAISSGTGGTGTLNYLWAPSGGTTTTENNLAIGTYTVTVTDSNGCQDTAQVIITEPPVLTLTTSQSDELCFGGSTASANVIPTGGSGSYTYAWSNAATTATITGIIAGPYSVTVTDGNGCTATATVTIMEPAVLSLTTSQVDETCFGGNTGSATVTGTGGTGAYVYSWSPSGGNGQTASGLTATSYTVNVTDANGCFTSASVTITEPSAVTVSLTAVDANCNQSDGSVTAVTGGGTGVINCTWTPSGSGDSLTGIPSGTYTVLATDGNGCTATATIVVNNLNGVNATIASATQILCFGQSTGAIVVSQTGGVGPYSYNWSPNISITDTANGIPAGNYQIDVMDINGCISTVSTTITEPPLLTVSASASPAIVCEGSPVQLNATPAGGNPAYTVNWMPGNLIGNSPLITPTVTGNDTVFVVDANGCTANAIVSITVNAMPTASFISDAISGCQPLCVNFSDASTIASTGNITTWSWDFGDGNNSSLQNPSHCYTNSGFFTVILTVTSADGCTNTITMTNYINVFANPVAEFGASPQPTTIMNPEIFFTDSSTNATSWAWSFGDLIPSSTSILQNPSFVYPGIVTCYQVSLSVTSTDGCIDTVSHPVCFDPDISIYVPNAFTPNDDGTNDLFFPLGIGLDPDKYELWIFDRWGNMIFYTNDLNKGWDGKVQGGAEIAQIDTYVWKIKVKDLMGISHNMEGKVSLIK